MDAPVNMYVGNAPAMAQQQNCLSEDFRSHTSDIHKKTLGHPFFKKIFEGSLSKESYTQYLTDRHYVYNHLEKELDAEMKRELRLQRLDFSGLARSDYIAKDLQSSKFKDLSQSHSTDAEEYASHLQFLGSSKPLLLLSHSYVLYLADLSGGMIIKKSLAAQWPDAVNSYDFDSLFSKQSTEYNTSMTFKKLYKERLDSLAVTPEERKLLLDETQKAYAYAEKLLDVCLRI